MSFELTGEQRLIRDAIRDLCRPYPDAYWRELDRTSGYPDAFIRALSEGGWLAALIPEESEVLGLLALMEIQASRLAARTRPDGTFAPLTEQNRARWDRVLIGRGLAALERHARGGGARRLAGRDA